MSFLLPVLLVFVSLSGSIAWLSSGPLSTRHGSFPPSSIHHQSRRTTQLQLAGGFGGSSGKKTPKKEAKLKPKQQWDRYTNIKSPSIAVGVQIDDTTWLPVGRIKTQDVPIEVAVARQRALIAEHANRLYPLQAKASTALQWGYRNDDDDDSKEEWIVVNKSVLETVTGPFEKTIGFEGIPDPSTGFYCLYNEGRLVTSDNEVRPSSKKLQ